jgi:transmembrane sensor
MQEQDKYMLIVSYLEGNIAEKDSEYLLKWLANEENKMFFEEVKTTWELSKKASLPLNPDIEQEWQQFKLIRDNQTFPARKIVYFSPGRILQAAAIFLAIFGIYYIYYSVIHRSDYDSSSFSSNNKVLMVHLTDGTSVWLNKQTTIHYSSLYKKERNVILEGEAYFEVSRDSTRPFIIKAGPTQTRVLGTAFNLKATPNSSLVELTIVRGKVLFSTSKNRKLILKAGEQGIAVKETDSLIKKENADINILSWKDSTLVFRNQNVEKVIPDIEHYFNIKVLYPTEIDTLTFTGEYPHPTLNEFISVFSLSLNLEYKINGDTVHLTRK